MEKENYYQGPVGIYRDERIDYGEEVKTKLKFYKEKKTKIRFRLLYKQEYFFEGTVENDLEDSAKIKLASGDELILLQKDIDPLSIHPASYNPIQYFERKPISEELRQEVFERDNNICKIKLLGCTSKAEEVDHIIPVSKGGLNILSNLQASCSHCNRVKSNN